MTYTTTGRAMRQTAIQTTGIPASAPGRSQPSGGWPGGSSNRIGSSAAGGVASGPKPSAPPAANNAHTTSEPRASAMAIRSGVTDSEPRAIARSSRPVASAPKNTRPPSTTGAPMPKRISSSVHAIGWSTATTTASRVNPIMIARKVRLPKPGSVAPGAMGTLMAM